MKNNPRNLSEEITAKAANGIIRFAYPDMFAVLTRFDLAINFAKLDGRNLKGGLRHFAREFLKKAKHPAIKQMLESMAVSQFPESFRPQFFAALDKARKLAVSNFGVRK